MATQVYPSFVKSAGESGALREFWIKMTGLQGLAAAAVADVIENPFPYDLVILEAFIYVTTLSGAVNTDLDIGLGDDEDGTNVGAELADGLEDEELNVAQVCELGVVHAIATPPVLPIWKAPNADHNAADSWLVGNVKGTVAASGLRYNLYVKVIPVDDLA